MKINYSLKRHFTHKFYVYLLSAVVISAGVSLAIHFKTRLDAKEVFNVFVSVPQIDVDKDKTNDLFVPYFDNQIKDFSINAFSSSSFDFSKMYQTIAVNSDLVILNESALTMVNPLQYLEMPEKYHNENNYIANDKQIGMKIFDGENGFLKDEIKFKNENYYVFVNVDSVHCIDFKDSGETNIISKIFEGVFR